MDIIWHYGAGLVIMAILDAIWLKSTVNRLYRPIIGDLMAKGVNWGAGIVFYLMYPLGVVLLAVRPAEGRSLSEVAATAAILGAFTYATYDLTNQATLRVWSSRITIADILWGTFLTAAIAVGSAWFVGLFA